MVAGFSPRHFFVQPILARKPAYGLPDVGNRRSLHQRGMGRVFQHALTRKVILAEGNRHGEGCADAEPALDGDGTTVQFNEFLDQCQPNTGSFMAATPRAFHAPKSLEQVRQLALRNACPRVAHGQTRRRPIARNGDTNAAVKSRLECVRDQVQDDLFPHLPVDIHGLGQRRALNCVLHTGALYRGTEDAGKLSGQKRKIRRLVSGVKPARLDAHKIEQPVHHLQQAKGVAMQHLNPGTRGRLLIGERVLDWPQNQGERRAQLMTHVREERRLRAIQLG